MAILSLLGIVNVDPTIINDTNFPLPTGLAHETLDPILLAETAELEILYPEPTTLSTVIKAWSTARGQAWAKMATALAAEYNPIHNYDRTESWTEAREGESSRAGTNEGSGQSSGSSTGTQDVAGYNAAGAVASVPKTKDTGSSSGSSSQSGEWSEDGSNSESSTRTGRIQGNIGVTTSQQMIQSELELRQMDLYRIIVEEFKRMFCLGVY
jgi:hypothetical protein